MKAVSQLAVRERLDHIFDAGSVREIPGPLCAVTAGPARLAGTSAMAVAFDRSRQGGSIGRLESERLAAAFGAAQRGGLPIVMCVDSAGGRLTEGAEALAAFRAMFRAGLDAKARGVPMLALLPRNAFGGGSLVAYLGEARVYCEATRLAMSGPAIIEALGGRAELDSKDGDAVRALMGGDARARHGGAERLVADDAEAFRAAAADWITRLPQWKPPDLAARHQWLGERLAEAGTPPSPPRPNLDLPGALARQLDALLPEGYTANLNDGVLWGAARSGGVMFSLAGLLEGRPVGARAAWELADAVLRLEQADPRAVLLMIDAPGHATRRFDESVILSAYLVHLAEVLHAVGARRPLSLLVTGAGAGGIFVSVASPARQVWALAGAQIRELPPEAVAQVLDGVEAGHVALPSLVAAGVAERALSTGEFARHAADIFD